MKLATKASLGRGDELAGRADLEDPSVGDHADAVGERGGVLEVVRDEDRRAARGRGAAPAARRGRPRACARRAPPSARRAGARPGRGRARGRAQPAGARRRRARAGVAFARCAIRNRSSSSARAVAAAEADVRAHDRCGKSAYSWKTRPTLRRSGARSTPAAVSSQTSPSSATRPLRGRSNPATTRSTVVFPAPDGPTSANVSPGSTVSVDCGLEGAKRDGRSRRRAPSGHDLDQEQDHGAEITTSSALIARARSKSTSNCS